MGGTHTAICPLNIFNILKNIVYFINTQNVQTSTGRRDIPSLPTGKTEGSIHNDGASVRTTRPFLRVRRQSRVAHKKGRLTRPRLCLVLFPAPSPPGREGFSCTVEDHDIPLGQNTGFLQHLLFRQFRDGVPNLSACFL